MTLRLSGRGPPFLRHDRALIAAHSPRWSRHSLGLGGLQGIDGLLSSQDCRLAGRLMYGASHVALVLALSLGRAVVPAIVCAVIPAAIAAVISAVVAISAPTTAVSATASSPVAAVAAPAIRPTGHSRARSRAPPLRAIIKNWY